MMFRIPYVLLTSSVVFDNDTAINYGRPLLTYTIHAYCCRDYKKVAINLSITRMLYRLPSDLEIKWSESSAYRHRPTLGDHVTEDPRAKCQQKLSCASRFRSYLAPLTSIITLHCNLFPNAAAETQTFICKAKLYYHFQQGKLVWVVNLNITDHDHMKIENRDVRAAITRSV